MLGATWQPFRSLQTQYAAEGTKTMATTKNLPVNGVFLRSAFRRAKCDMERAGPGAGLGTTASVPMAPLDKGRDAHHISSFFFEGMWPCTIKNCPRVAPGSPQVSHCVAPANAHYLTRSASPPKPETVYRAFLGCLQLRSAHFRLPPFPPRQHPHSHPRRLRCFR